MDHPLSEPPPGGAPTPAGPGDDPWRRTLDLLLSMGTELLRPDPARAVECFRQAVELARQLGHGPDEGRALLHLGQAELGRGSLAAAAEALEPAYERLRIAGGSAEQVGCLNALGRLRARQGRLEDALGLLRSALAGTTEGPMTTSTCAVRAVTLETLGTIYREKGEPDQALRYFQEALELRRAERNPDGVAQDLNHLGNLHVRLGRYLDAIDYFEGALSYWRQNQDRRSTAGCANNLAAVFIHLGRLRDARALLEESRLVLAELGESGHVATVHTNLGLLASLEGRMDEAEEQFRECLRISRQIDDAAGQANALNNLSMLALQRGRPEEAITFGEESLRLRELVGLERGMAKPLRNVAHAFLELGRLAEAEGRAVDALSRATRAGDEEQRAEVLALLGLIRLERGDRDAGLTSAEEAFRIAETLGDPHILVLCCHTVARVRLEGGDLDEAKHLLGRAARLMRGWEHPFEKACVFEEEGRLALQAGGLDAGIERLRKAEEEYARLGNARRRLRVLGRIAAALGTRDREQARGLLRAGSEIAQAHGLVSYFQALLEQSAVEPRPEETLPLTDRAVVGMIDELVARRPDLPGAELDRLAGRIVDLACEALRSASDIAAVGVEVMRTPAPPWLKLSAAEIAVSDHAHVTARCELAVGGAPLVRLHLVGAGEKTPDLVAHRALLRVLELGLTVIDLRARLVTAAPGSVSAHEVAEIERELGTAGFEGLVGSSPAMRGVHRLIERAAPSESTILILGESGTGKELVARAIHQRSGRRQKPFVPVNCPSIPRDLIESELFGHERGAFTGAVATRAGKVEQADGGTLFLDEIGDMTLTAQVKLLRFLQEREFERVGGQKTLRANVRVLAATSRDLPRMIEQGTFREDLYYRLHVVPIRMPALRERPEDVPVLTDHFLRGFARSADRIPWRLGSGVREALRAHPWPGNVRELQNVIEYLATLAVGDEIELAHLPADLRARGVRGRGEGVASLPGDAVAIELRPGETLESRLMQLEATLIRSALRVEEWNQSAAARRLGITESMMRNRMRQYSIQRPEEESS
ncbi:MAG: sigma 54-interacting transcriptional regulator [Candidatus Eisenbacteria bacterium]|nr:sigma 54-interacting transcriptional regulator [Candidatus Eisenbacteria bacterium]MCC7142911.1 sigma 54-interacting transcriptional regulator [Candidatus Eisenbacteria bacterium]